MFQKLKRKFILVNMALLTLVFALIFTIIAVLTVTAGHRQTQELLHKATFFGSERPPAARQRPPITGALMAEFNSSGELVRIIAPPQLDTELANKAATQALSQALPEGHVVLEEYDFAYVARTTPEGTYLAMMDQQNQKYWIRNSILILMGVSLGSLLLLLALSIFFANRAVRPIKTAFEKQEAFIADASHELKTPLAILNTNLAVVEQNPGETVESQQKWLSVINSQTDRMAGLINDMLTLASLGTSGAKSVRVEFSSLLTGCLLSFEAMAFESELELQSEIAEQITVLGDFDKLTRLADILLDNAVKHTPCDGSITVTLCREKGHALFTVKNTGACIPAQDLPHVFDRFYRVDSSRARETGGYGLGLAIAKAIVEEAHGKISVTSGQDGTAFTVDLRAVE